MNPSPDDHPAGPPAPPPVPEAAPPPLPLVAAPAAQTIVTNDDRTLAMLCHLLGMFTGFLGPLVLWLIKKDDSRFIEHHAREALNFQITIMVAMFGLGLVTFVLMAVLIGFLLIPVLVALPIFALVVEILAAVAASDGQWHRYPLCMRLVQAPAGPAVQP